MKRISVYFVALIVLISVLAACYPKPKTEGALYLETPIKPREKDTRQRFGGRVVLSDISNLSFSFSGQIVALNVKVGDQVKAGEEIARLDTRSLEMDVAVAEASLEVAQAQLAKVKVPVHPAQIRELEIKATTAAEITPRNLNETKQFAAESAMAQAEIEYLMAQPPAEDVAAAEAEVVLAQRRLEAARARLEQMVLVAPTAGTITQVNVKAHEYAATGQTVVQLADISKLYIEVTIPANKIGGMKVGDTVVVSLGGPEVQEVEGVVTNVQPTKFDGEAENFLVSLMLPQGSEALRWGMVVEVILPE